MKLVKFAIAAAVAAAFSAPVIRIVNIAFRPILTIVHPPLCIYKVKTTICIHAI